MAASCCSRRTRPWLSRATWLVDRRSMRLPSASVWMVSVVMSDDRFAISRRQFRDGASQPRHVSRVRQRRARIVRRGRLGCRAVERHEAAFPPQTVSHEVPRDTVQIGAEARSVRLVPGQVAHQRDEHVLRDVLRDGGGPAHHAREPVDNRVVSRVDSGKCFALPACRTPDQVAVRCVSRWHARHPAVIVRKGRKVPGSCGFRL